MFEASATERFTARAGVSVAEAVALYAAPLEELASAVAAAQAAPRPGRILHVARLEYGNICANACPHCAQSRPPMAADAVLLSPEEVARRAAMLAELRPHHVHLVGRWHPGHTFSYVLDTLAAVREALPDTLIEGLSAQQVYDLAEAEKLSVDTVLERLRDAGLTRLTGDGGEVFSSRVRDVLCPRKITGGRWLHVMRRAHALGITSTASMTFGHLETPREKAEHLALIRDLQEESGGFEAYWPEPLADGYRTRAVGNPPTAEDFLRELGIGRIMLPTIPRVQCRFVPPMTLEFLAQAPAFGADEIVCLTCFRAASDSPEIADIEPVRAALGL
ncbi:MAG: radical SAM protein [Armatimonadetes bacterium]|nr:radical SAM protein [Armatimonadota bacterium]